MKILLAIKNMNNAKGGAERVFAFVANGLAQKGHDVTILTFDKEGAQSFYPLNPDINWIQLNIGNAEKQATLSETMPRILKIRQYAISQSPDIVIPFMHSMFVPTTIALIGTKIPVIASEHIVPMHYNNRKGEYLLFMLSSIFMRKITILSQAVKNLYPKFLQQKMIIIPNPVMNNKSSNQRPITRNKTILNVGRLDHQKDQQTLIHAFASIAEKHPEWTVKIFGEGGLHESLQMLIVELGVEKQVFLMGTTPQIETEYLQSSIFALPSRYESFGLATAEAMSFGLPAIGFQECAGTNEIIIHNENGLLVSKQNQDKVKIFADALDELMTNDEQRQALGKNASKITERFDAQSVLQKWENALQEITTA